MARHAAEYHDSEDIEWSMKVVGSFRLALERQIDEAVRINTNSSKADIIINNQSEWNAAITTKWACQSDRPSKKKNTNHSQKQGQTQNPTQPIQVQSQSQVLNIIPDPNQI